MTSVFDIAAHIESRLGQVGAYKLNKLAYYVQAWSLVWRGRPAFPERIEAWRDGPVARDLWAQLTYYSGLAVKNAPPLPADEQALVDRVLLFYGHMTADQLIEFTHREDPWLRARGGLPPVAPSSNEISLDSMRAYYAKQWEEAAQDNQALKSPPAFVGSVDDLEKFLEG